MSVVAREFELKDGSVVTCQEMMAKTGWGRGTCYARLLMTDDPKELYKELSLTQKGRIYTLDDGSKWTSESLSLHLGCRRSTAGARLSTMGSESKRVLAPYLDNKHREDRPNTSAKKQRELENRMFWDKQGHWKLLNNMEMVK